MMRDMSGRVPFVTGLDHIEVMGSVARYVMYLDEGSGKSIVRRYPIQFIMPNASVPDAILKASRVPYSEALGMVKRMFPGFWVH